MSKTLKLWQVANYSKERINVGDILLENFVTVDNLLPNKKGLTIALNKPPRGGTLLKFKMGNILVGNIRPYLKKIWFANRDGAAAADVLVFDVKTEHCSKYVYYAMFRDDFFNHMMRGKKGTKMPRGDKNQIMDFLIPNVKYTTQQQFAAVLSALDIKIEHNNR
ncbi:MAG: restriction endonuclease subunit S, partial [Bacteroidetes bacterium]|nr:restriction endonuclease subunit S [Bacteroidota bacterium]